MFSITLDPRLLAPPPSSESADKFREYVERLLSWKTLTREARNGLSVLLSERAANCLGEDGALPLADSLFQILRGKGLIDYDANTVRSFCEAFFKLDPSFQNYCRIDDLLYEDVVIEPSLPPESRLPRTSVEAESCVVALAIMTHCECADARAATFAIIPPFANSDASVTATLSIVDHRRTDLETIDVLPTNVSGKVNVCHSFDDFASNGDLGIILEAAQNKDEVRLAIRLAIYGSRIDRHLDPDWDDLPKFLIGDEFRMRAQIVSSANSGGVMRNVIRAAVDAIENLNNQQTHWIRTGDSGNDPQLTRGDFRAWRRDIASDIHLHYWKGSNGLIELAWVSHPHDDFHIPDPSEE